MNDLWKYTPISKKWTFKGGSHSIDEEGTFSRFENSSWPSSVAHAAYCKTSRGSVWIFGGSVNTMGISNNLWIWQPTGWTWIGGSKNISNQFGNYSQNRPWPGSRMKSTVWTDSKSVWLFGGFGYAESGEIGLLNDLWRYHLSLKKWRLVSGTRVVGDNGTYEQRNIPSSSNFPSARESTIGWISGRFLWLFGGSDNLGNQNDMWTFSYDSQTPEWTWIGGHAPRDDPKDKLGIYGTVRVYQEDAWPGARFGATGVKITQQGEENYWMWGGFGFDGYNDTTQTLSDLWVFSNSYWIWMGGSDTGGLNPSVSEDEPVIVLGPQSLVDGQDTLWLSGDEKISNESSFTLWRYYFPIVPQSSAALSSLSFLLVGVSIATTLL